MLLKQNVSLKNNDKIKVKIDFKKPNNKIINEINF